MKRSILIFLAIILTVCAASFSLAACKENDRPVTVTISFDVGELKCDTPQSITYTVGENVVLPYPEVEDMPEGFESRWFTDSKLTTIVDDAFLNDRNLPSEIILYYGYSPKTYSITYTNKDEFDFSGEFPSSYVYGEGVKLPQADLGFGYLSDAGKWYYDDNNYFTTGVSTKIYGDLVLTYRPTLIKYAVNYNCGVDGVENPNPTVYDVTMGTVKLLPLSSEGKTFLYWEYRSSKGNQGVIEEIGIEIFKNEMSFTIWAVWAD